MHNLVIAKRFINLYANNNIDILVKDRLKRLKYEKLPRSYIKTPEENITAYSVRSFK